MKAAKRNSLPASKFALPGKRKYPIDTEARARSALSRAADPNNEGSYDTVRAKVTKRYPGLKKTDGGNNRSRGRGKKKGHAKQQSRLKSWG